MKRTRFVLFTFLLSSPATADMILFSTGTPTNAMAAATRPGVGGKIEIEAADDFLNTSNWNINSATFTGLITGATPTVGEVAVEIYRVFPNDSTNPPSGNVPTRANSPSDVAFTTRDSAAGQLSFSVATIGTGFTATNSVLNGINRVPNQTTGGEGPVTGTEVTFTVTFATPINLPPDHYFFVPQVQVTGGEFYWLSGQRPLTGQFAFTPDLQAWIRNSNLDPDWLRVGTDIVGGTTPPTFNMDFSLIGTTPEPSTFALLAGAVALVAGYRRMRA
jgi:hypothetical protein